MSRLNKNIISIFVFLVLIFQMPSLLAQSNDTNNKEEVSDSLNIITSFRVNFDALPEQQEIFDVYKNYLYSNPVENDKNNPYWNSTEKEKYDAFDLSVPSIYKSSDFLNDLNDLKTYLDIYILSIDKIKDDFYSISAQYQFKGGLSNSSSIWCIQNINAVKENGEWKLQNNLVHYTEHWGTSKTPYIVYHYPHGYNFKSDSAEKANHFFQNLVKEYNLEKPKKVDYYLAESTNQMGELLGFGFFGGGVTTGVSSVGNGYIMSSETAFHAHEFVHFAFASNKIKRNFLIEEGVADFLGSRIYDKESYEENMKKLINDIKNDDTYTIESLISMNENVSWNNYNWRYPFGALICKMVYDKKGEKGLKKLMFSNTEKTDELKAVLIDLMNFKDDQQLYKELKSMTVNHS